MQRLTNKTILVTGAAQGIGAACAQLAVANGATVILTDINAELGEKTAGELGPAARFIHADVSIADDWQHVDDWIQREYHGQIDGLVNNAGITGFLETSGPHDPEHLDMTSWDKVMSVNVTGTVLGCKYAIRWLKESGGSIVNISSRSGIVGIPGAAAYAASKAAVRNHSKTVALYCAQKHYPVRCNSVHPAAILTPMWDAMLGTGEQREQALTAISKDIPLGTMGDAADVANAVLYLLSDESRYVTGIELNIDGGILAGSAAAPA
jgi:NAD(P)-dependent dehydrogenase (short-subunit alcohol dehydrogenase family)